MAVIRARGTRAAAPFEAVLRALTEDADVGVLLIDPHGRLAASNAFGRRLLAAGGGRGRPQLRTVVASEDPLRDARLHARTESETVLLPSGGNEVPALLRTYRIGRPPWVLLTARDLTRTRRMQQELRRHERLATLGQLSAGVAHEIRNPLAGIGTSAQVLMRRFEPRDDRARFVQVILDEVERLDRIVTSLLQYARPRTPELRPVALHSCLDRVLELSSESIAQAGVQVERLVAPRLPDVYIDPDLVVQVLLNVTRNAVQAMAGGGVLRYEVRRVLRWAAPRGAGRRASDPATRAGGPAELRSRRTRLAYQQVRVSDTGIGIPRGQMSKLFDPFFSTRPGGTGLGLSISQTIMQEHGGSIEIASREGRGTTVLLNFPMEKRQGERRNPGA
jgi:two-component system sensor histidine kinase HydH